MARHRYPILEIGEIYVHEGDDHYNNVYIVISRYQPYAEYIYSTLTENQKNRYWELQVVTSISPEKVGVIYIFDMKNHRFKKI